MKKEKQSTLDGRNVISKNQNGPNKESQNQYKDEEILIFSGQEFKIDIKFSGLDFDKKSNCITLKLIVDNNSGIDCEIYIRDLYANHLLYEGCNFLDTVKNGRNILLKQTINDPFIFLLEGIDSLETLRFFVEVKDEEEHKKAVSKVLILECDYENESYAVKAIEECQDVVLDTILEETNVSVMTYNCLKRAGINSLRDICDKTPEELMQIRSLGQKKYQEISLLIQEYGLSMNESAQSANRISYNTEYDLTVIHNGWRCGISNLYSPHLSLKVWNMSHTSKTDITITAIFYDLETKEMWEIEPIDLIEEGSHLLTDCFVIAKFYLSRGYVHKWDKLSLHKTVAEIFINNQSYGYIEIKNTYDYLKTGGIIQKRYSFEDISLLRVTDKDFHLVVKANFWEESDDIYVPHLMINLTRQFKRTSEIGMTVVFFNMNEQEVFSVVSKTIVSAETPHLMMGYKIPVIIEADKGMDEKVPEECLPNIIATVFINDVCYGEIPIMNTYEYRKVSQQLMFQNPQKNKSIKKNNSSIFYPIIKAKNWQNTGGRFSVMRWGPSEDFFVPCIQMDIENHDEQPAKKIDVKAVFYNMENKCLYSYDEESLITENEAPLKQGYQKKAFLFSDVGYSSHPDECDLPDIFAEIFINDEFYGSCHIEPTYEYRICNDILQDKRIEFENNINYPSNTGSVFLPVIQNSGWREEDEEYQAFIKLKIINQADEAIDNIRIKAIFYDEEKRKTWCEVSDIVIPSGISLRKGFGVLEYLYSEIGLSTKIPKKQLPNLIADIYINGDFIGIVKIGEKAIGNGSEKPLVNDISSVNDADLFEKAWYTASFLHSYGYSTEKSFRDRRAALKRAVHDYGENRVMDHINNLLKRRKAQKTNSFAHLDAIAKWASDLLYLEEL